VDNSTSGRTLLAKQSGVRNVLTRIVGALLGLATAYTLTRWLIIGRTLQGETSATQLVVETAIFLAIAGLTLTLTSVVPIRHDLVKIHRVVGQNEEELRQRNRGQRFLQRVQTAFDMAETEADLFSIAGTAMRDAADFPGEILVADSSLAHLQRVATADGHDAPGCTVTTPRNCPAVRSGQTLRFPRANDLSACPRLRERGLDDAHASVCVPVNVLGTPTAVLHSGRDSTHATTQDLEDNVIALEGVAVRFGTRLGMMRAMSQAQLQADTDPLTGLLNRRAMENRIRDIRTDSSSFCIAMADLDRFKSLNDTYGHDTGDRALRLFSRVLQTALRDTDVVSRHGGEEFLIVLPDSDLAIAREALDRIRERLAEALGDAKLPHFTVSIGVTDMSTSDDLTELINQADQALLWAKSDGRDRVVVWDPTRASNANASPDSIDVDESEPHDDLEEQPVGRVVGLVPASQGQSVEKCVEVALFGVGHLHPDEDATAVAAVVPVVEQ
jgi:diguanylate cyclase (GGDEF)-like protein